MGSMVRSGTPINMSPLLYITAAKQVSWSESALLYAMVLKKSFCKFVDYDIHRKLTRREDKFTLLVTVYSHESKVTPFPWWKWSNEINLALMPTCFLSLPQGMLQVEVQYWSVCLVDWAPNSDCKQTILCECQSTLLSLHITSIPAIQSFLSNCEAQCWDREW